MVDFKKRLAHPVIERPRDPLVIYDKLDRASDKGPLRPAQGTILAEWFKSRRGERDLILKAHTGSGKTLVGLLMLRSYLNDGAGPVVYLCPNEYLVQQTLEQADAFGIAAVPAGNVGLPTEFEAGKAILVCNVQTMFNGLTRFKLGAQSLRVAAICLDDAHACVESIRAAFTITLRADEPAYKAIRTLFEPDLREQGLGRYADIEAGDYGALLPVPYWAWREHAGTIASILAKYKDAKGIKFAWPVTGDLLADCLCVVSGTQLQVVPYQPPLHLFGSFDRAPHRIFMSATVADDSFLVRGVGVAEAAVNTPLRDPSERWAGEKMILIPSLVDETLDDAEIVHMFAQPVAKRTHGVVALCPTFAHTARWESQGALIVKTETIEEEVARLRSGDGAQTLVAANRYDGIDLPDDSCRILVLDSAPRPESLLDRYVASVREGSDSTLQRTTRAIEQGLGRAVRGEKDFCVVLLIGPDLVKLVRTPAGRKFLSAQTRLQIELGLEIAEMAKSEIEDGKAPRVALRTLIQQALNRDEGWKEFYVQQMDTLEEPANAPRNLSTYVAERLAEEQYRKQNIDGAVKTLKKLIASLDSPSDEGWYLQEIARYLHVKSKTEANDAQRAAHAANPLLLKPQQGMQVPKLAAVTEARAEKILVWIQQHGTYEELAVTVAGIATQLRFGAAASDFEKAVDELGQALGFSTQRPDRQFKAGPDNLWALGDNRYLLFEAKSEVLQTRAEINKGETGQMNNACAWFARGYPDAIALRFLVMPTRKLAKGAGFNDDVRIMRAKHLRELAKHVAGFFAEFSGTPLLDITEVQVRERLAAHKLTVKDLGSGLFSESPIPTSA